MPGAARASGIEAVGRDAGEERKRRAARFTKARPRRGDAKTPTDTRSFQTGSRASPIGIYGERRRKRGTPANIGG